MGAQFISLMTILIALGSVCFLAFITTKFLGKRSAAMLKSKYMTVIDSLSMGFDKTIYLVKVGEQYVLMYSSTKGFDFICNVDASNIDPNVLSIDEQNKGSFKKYFDFFKTSDAKNKFEKSNMNDNLQKLRDAFNNRK